MSDRPLPAEKMRSWKLALITYLAFGPFAALATLIPNYSLAALIIAISLSTIGAAGAVLVGRKRRRLGHIAFGNAYFLLFLTIGARAWYMIVGNNYLWALWTTLLVAAYILAWALPSLNPRLSALLWKEQYTPKTRVGKTVLSISAKILPIASTGGALFGMYATRAGHDNSVILFIAIASCLVSIGLAQIASHNFWREDRLREQRLAEAK